MSHFADQKGSEQHPSIGKKEHETSDMSTLPSAEEIGERAYHLWWERGCQEGTAEQNWLEAERELQDAALSRRWTQIAQDKGGSVQS
jgi:hypothetical protein